MPEFLHRFSMRKTLWALVLPALWNAVWIPAAQGAPQSDPPVDPRADNPLARDFAYCAGRLSAEAAHREDRELMALKRAMQDLLAAVIAPETAPSYEELRIAGHVSQTELLALSRFSFDTEEAHRAETLAESNIRHCRNMLLGG
ncbi:hypothetical protein [Celeribacter ethanolicus]|uniref:hypothetical protein n=1 Tax=Celeribacter ethanolicus TaxID=1758178 RepID=UPI00082CC0BF|nr:hypothetical protein [Celeribacter ethanolicus]